MKKPRHFLQQRRRALARKLPNDVIASWPEVFGDIRIKAIPAEYLQSIRVTFKDKEVWEIQMDSKEFLEDGVTAEEVVAEMLEEYNDEIATIDFRVHTQKVKRDMIKNTRKFMKGKFKKK